MEMENVTADSEAEEREKSLRREGEGEKGAGDLIQIDCRAKPCRAYNHTNNH